MKTVRSDRKKEIMRTCPKACVLGIEHGAVVINQWISNNHVGSLKRL